MPRNEELSLSSLGIQMPYNMQAEQSVLGAALMDETVLNRLITDMEPEMFYSDQNRALFTPRAKPSTSSRWSTPWATTAPLPVQTMPRSTLPTWPRRSRLSPTSIPT